MSLGDDTIGPHARVERVLSNYGLGADGLADDLVQSDQLRLQLAILLEQRGEDSIVDAEVSASQSEDDQPNHPEYVSGSIEATVDPEPIDLDFSASSIVVRRVTSPIWVAFRPPDDDPKARIQIDPDQDEVPYVASPPGLSASKVWIGRPDSATDSSVMVGAFD